MYAHFPLKRTPKMTPSRAGTNLLVVAAIAAFIAGCAGSEQYRAGKRLLDAGEYDQAVEAFHRAAAQNPDSTRYRMSLAEAQSLSADEHVGLAEEYSAQHRATDAKKEVQIVLEQVPAHPRGVGLVNTIEREIERCEEILARAQQEIDAEKWPEAVRLVDQAKTVDASHPSVPLLRAKALEPMVAERLERARKALDERDWQTCETAIADVRSLDPNNAAAAELERKLTAHRDALGHLDTARPLADKGEYADAIKSLRQAASLWPENEKIAAELKRVIGLAIDGLIARADSEIEAGRFAAGIEAIDHALAIVPDSDDLTTCRQQTIDRWVGDALNRYERHAMAGQWELAWAQAVRAAAVSPTVNPRATQGAARAEREIRRGIACKLAAVPLKSPVVGPRKCLGICNVLSDALARVKPEHVQLLRPANPAELAKPDDLSRAIVKDRERLAALARRIGGADLLAFVDATRRDGTSAPIKQGDKFTIRLDLVEAATGRLLWTDAALPGAATEAGIAIDPLVHAKAGELFDRRSFVYLDDAKSKAGDEAIEDCVRFLFDCSAKPTPQALDAAVTGIFSPDITGDRLARAKQIVTERLDLDRPRPPKPPEPIASPAKPPARTVSPPPPPRAHDKKKGSRVFQGIVSRDDDRYPKELRSVDAIVVKVKDTDGSPLDADIEIRVGSHRKKYDDLTVGQRVRGRGISGRSYELVILAIEDDQQTVHFAIEVVPPVRR